MNSPDQLAATPVVILCGGEGTRIREASERLPKPMIDIGGRPILWHIMKIYAHHGYRRFVLCLGYKAWDIKEYFLRFRENSADFTVHTRGSRQLTFHGDDGTEELEVTCVETGLYTGTGGRIARVRDFIDTPRFMLTYGDGIGDVDIPALVDAHLEGGRIGTVTAVHPSSRYGEMRVDGSVVAEFNEKPTLADGWVSGGFFVFERAFFEYLQPDVDCFLEADPLRKLAADGELMMYPHVGFWRGMDTYREYTELNRMWDQDRAPWKVWT
jgi:glucose-1-phosphate cytidylyltransferase